MAKKGTTISLVIFGLLFVVLGVFMFLVPNATVGVMIIAGLDALFGMSLICGGLVAGSRGSNIRNDGGQDDQESDLQPDSCSDEDNYEGLREDDEPGQSDMEILDDPAELAAREGELREAAKRAAEEATLAKKRATAAVQEAKQAEDELTNAENALAHMSPSEQRSAMREIDNLAQIAARKSEYAVKEARNAKLAIRNAREAAELHNRAMDAAASALSGEDEFAEFI